MAPWKGTPRRWGARSQPHSEPFPPGWKIEPATGCTPNSQVPEPVACLHVRVNFVTGAYGRRQVPPAGGCTPGGRDTASSFRRKRHASRCHCSYVPRNTSRVVITGPRELQTPVLATPQLLTRYSRGERARGPQGRPPPSAAALFAPPTAHLGGESVVCSLCFE